LKVLVLGSKGQLGRCLNDQLDSTDLNVIYTSRELLDITNFEETKSKIFDFFPDIVINATAYTAVDKAEEEQEMANIINNLAVANLAKICKQLDSWLIHISTDYVFDGNSDIPYIEDDKKNPQNIYGETKLNGELAIQSLGCNHIIIRTAWLFSEYGNNFLKTMLRLGEDRDELSIVGDQVGSPTYAQDLAKVIVIITNRLKDDSFASGIYHYCGFTSCSWYQFAKLIFLEADQLNFRSPKKLREISSNLYEKAAKRPDFSILNCSKLDNVLNLEKPELTHGIKNSLKALIVNDW
tara:strand:- start:2448 stop:3332 length:885 start_codon:yes stop_codon:yes gene_type:complete